MSAGFGRGKVMNFESLEDICQTIIERKLATIKKEKFIKKIKTYSFEDSKIILTRLIEVKLMMLDEKKSLKKRKKGKKEQKKLNKIQNQIDLEKFVDDCILFANG